MGHAKMAAFVCGAAGLTLLVCGSWSFEGDGVREASNSTAGEGVVVGEELRSVSLPFESYDLGLKQIYMIRSAEDVLMKGCLARHGIDWNLIKQPSGIMSSLNRRRYGVIETEVAQEYGYHVVPDPEVAAASRADLARKKSMTSKELAVAYGVDGVGGCWKEGHETVQGVSGESSYVLYNQLTLKIFNESQKSVLVKNSTKRWSRCMQRFGYQYRNPLEAIGDKRWAQSNSPGHDEVNVALADVKCKSEVGLVGAWQKEERRLQERAIGENAAYFKQLKSAMEKNIRTARRILAT